MKNIKVFNTDDLNTSSSIRGDIFKLLILAALATYVLTKMPVDKTLGDTSRIVFLHGAWVWAAIISFIVCSLVSILGLINRKDEIQRWSRSWGRTATVFLITYLPTSLILMQASWNGLFLDEPRWRIPFNLAIVGLALQIGLSFLPLITSAIANPIFATILLGSLFTAEAVLHPESPISTTSSSGIKFGFYAILFILILMATIMARFWHRIDLLQSSKE